MKQIYSCDVSSCGWRKEREGEGNNEVTDIEGKGTRWKGHGKERKDKGERE
jgi:hypothetical protein